uniref:Uncharacterized protein n=1 Tax=Chromera velia CCMP2878 TaxID=1169474 RepID=A0A0G4FQ63_9ALVE|eukprot:Cvel_18224.t1-p1 / transcript=Cvel_18224.t1 / gene=Cvel_18224 / organism=Chromera_velia_CCMP2878 / gene_product=hypothetical protein / transcript_product=hypothetical protein / location=Cvel_scaffold1497:29094-33842(-) / protein_length=109 / sequence_SO=supercontig / SO=protein_coding / is_pseudo=false
MCSYFIPQAAMPEAPEQFASGNGALPVGGTVEEETSATRYEGDLNGPKGVIKFANGYEGEWAWDMAHGNGKEEYIVPSSRADELLPEDSELLPRPPSNMDPKYFQEDPS